MKAGCLKLVLWTMPAEPLFISMPVGAGLIACIYLGKRIGYGKEVDGSA